MKFDMLLPILLVLVISLLNNVGSSDLESFSSESVHHDLHHHDLHHHDLTHVDLHHHHADLHTELHHHDVIEQHGNHLHHAHHDVVVSTPQASGFWKKSFVWKPRWVKSWQGKKIYVAVWKHVWGPVQVSEWVPIPKPPPGWVKH
ncbi:knob-associated histidine-rich protein-like isoform X2 [Wyeomyia smithii]|uniref:knob-associated histidine-rich protein-like isoform X2 n=1 Tax=Wyeomyia smithii TaxID=174621 RepID=UPI002467FF6A|nr:knob-associated histidine-rich protein-like isoform X2 [Wyeomyia smithii]